MDNWEVEVLELVSIEKVASRSARSRAGPLRVSLHTEVVAADSASLFQKNGFNRFAGRFI